MEDNVILLIHTAMLLWILMATVRQVLTQSPVSIYSNAICRRFPRVWWRQRWKIISDMDQQKRSRISTVSRRRTSFGLAGYFLCWYWPRRNDRFGLPNLFKSFSVNWFGIRLLYQYRLQPTTGPMCFRNSFGNEEQRSCLQTSNRSLCSRSKLQVQSDR